MVGSVQYSVGRGCIVPHYTHVFYTTHYTYRGLWAEREEIYKYKVIINNKNQKKNQKQEMIIMHIINLGLTFYQTPITVAMKAKSIFVFV